MAAHPIYPDELSFALDQHFARVTDYLDIRFDNLLNQMRIDRKESLMRDESLLNRIEHIETIQAQHTEILNEHTSLLNAIAVALEIKNV